MTTVTIKPLVDTVSLPYGDYAFAKSGIPVNVDLVRAQMVITRNGVTTVVHPLLLKPGELERMIFA